MICLDFNLSGKKGEYHIMIASGQPQKLLVLFKRQDKLFYICESGPLNSHELYSVHQTCG